jgi:hypothetical protein
LAGEFNSWQREFSLTARLGWASRGPVCRFGCPLLPILTLGPPESSCSQEHWKAAKDLFILFLQKLKKQQYASPKMQRLYHF